MDRLRWFSRLIRERAFGPPWRDCRQSPVKMNLPGGQPPFVRRTAVETMAAHLSAPVAPLRSLVPEVSADLEEVVLRCLEREPSQRFRDVVAVEEALNNCESSKQWFPARAADRWRTRDAIPSLPTIEPGD